MKKTMLQFLLLFPLWGLGGFACTDTISVDVEGGEIQLSVDGEITDQPGPYTIQLSQTIKAFGSAIPPAVTGATVFLADNQGKTDTLRETSAGIYQTRSIRGRAGNTYTLTIKAPQFGTYTAQTEIRRTTRLDSVYAEYRDVVPGTTSSGYLVRYDYTDPIGIGDNFRAKLYQNNKLLNKPFNLSYVQDIYSDGKAVKDVLSTAEKFGKGDKAVVVLASLTNDAYQFLKELQEQTNNGGLFANPPANVRTNIINTNSTGKRAVGYFFGSAISTRSLTIN
jgi:hypothetical protein